MNSFWNHFFGSCLISSSAYLQGLKSATILSVYSDLWMCHYFQSKVSLIPTVELCQCKLTLPALFFRIPGSFLARSDDNFVWLLLKTNFSVLSFFSKNNFPPILYCVYRTKSFLINIMGAYQHICSLVALLMPELCLWSAKVGNSSISVDTPKSWTWCSNVVQTQMNEIGKIYLFLHCYGDYSCKVSWNEFFSCVGQFWFEFSCIALLLKRLHSGSKTDLTINGLIVEIFVELCFVLSSSYLHVLRLPRISALWFAFHDTKSIR